jgi:hypothetical protein
MSNWSAISLRIGFIAAVIAMIRRGNSSVTTLHIDH